MNENSEQLAVNVLNSTNEAIIAIDLGYRVVMINPAAQTLTGLSTRLALHHKIEDLFSGQKQLLYLITTAMEEGRSISDHETIFLKRSYAPQQPVSASASPLFSDNGTQYGVIITMHDATNLRQLQEDVQRADRLAMLGTLAAGLAHEIKNPLGGIRGAAQLLSMEMGKRPDLNEYTQLMVKETDRINSIIDELMNLTTPRTQTFGDVNLTRIINDIVLLQQQTKQFQKISFILQLDPSIPAINADELLITRLLLNIIKNAAEAVAENGTITISTRINTEHHLTQQGRSPVPFVVIKVHDNGPGISTEIMEKIFTPFFTTKSTGSGLGMAISQKIVNDHDGMLHINSNSEEGTCCSIYLPFRREQTTNNTENNSNGL